MKISARNMLKGTVVEVTKGATTVHVGARMMRASGKASLKFFRFDSEYRVVDGDPDEIDGAFG